MVATYIRGKHSPTYTPSQDMGNYVIVLNAEKVLCSPATSFCRFGLTAVMVASCLTAPPFFGNTLQVVVSGKKSQQKTYFRHTQGRPGGYMVETFSELQKVKSRQEVAKLLPAFCPPFEKIFRPLVFSLLHVDSTISQAGNSPIIGIAFLPAHLATCSASPRGSSRRPSGACSPRAAWDVISSTTARSSRAPSTPTKPSSPSTSRQTSAPLLAIPPTRSS